MTQLEIMESRSTPYSFYSILFFRRLRPPTYLCLAKSLVMSPFLLSTSQVMMVYFLDGRVLLYLFMDLFSEGRGIVEVC